MSEARPPGGRRPALPARLLGAGARAGERVASATGLDAAVEVATEEAIVRALESPAVQRAIIRVLESEEAQESFGRTISSPAVGRAAAKALDSDVVNQAWDRLLDSEEVQSLIERIAEAPEIRAAIASQGASLIGDLGRQIRRIADRLDGGLERVVRRLVGKPRTAPVDSVGLVSRGIAFLIDGAILNGAFLAAAAVISALFGSDGLSTAGWVFGAAAWLFFGGLYLFTFWSLAGQTPGMRFLSIRIVHQGSHVLGPRVARRRLFGLVVAIIPFGLGLLGIVTRDNQRGFQDRHADTDVVRVDPVTRYARRPAE